MGLVSKARWYAYRIKAMSPAELAHRAGEAIKRAADRKTSHTRAPAAMDRGELPPLPGLREGLSAFSPPPELIREWEEEYARAQSGRYFLLGREWPAHDGAPHSFHFDPVSRTPWPRERHCFSIDYRHNDIMGDVKYVWELNRLQYLQPVAALGFIRKDEAMLRYCLAEVERWIAENPPHFGVNWPSGIELGLRVVSILFVTTLAGEYITDAQRAAIWGTLEAHGEWLERYPSRFSSANNHLTAEGLGLFTLGTLCKQLPCAGEWAEEGWKLLCDTAEKQILPDGVGAEQTPNYTAVVLEMLLLGRHLARASGVSVPALYDERLQKSGEYLRWFMDEQGNTPRIGDDDNARVLGAYRLDETYIRSVLGSIAATFNRGDLSPPAEKPHLRQALFGVAPALAPAPEGVRLFDSGGYTVGRFRPHGREAMLIFDHGYLGYLSIAAHGHADALSLWLHVGGVPVLADAGTYLYHSGGAWRRHFRSTAAHNTLTLEETDSSTMSGHFNWSHKASARLLSSETAAGRWRVEAEQDGYKKKFGCLHRRILTVDEADGFTVEDYLTGGNAPRAVSVNFLLHPSCTATKEGESLTIAHEGSPLLRMRHEGTLATQIHPAGSEKGGWYSPTFGIKEEAARIAFTGMLAPEERAVTHVTFLP